jgi:hypothetical protein
MIARSATTSTPGNGTADAPAEMIPIIKTLLCRYFFLRHLCKKTETEYDQFIESLSHAKFFLKEKTVIKRLFMEVIKNQASDKMAGKFAKYIYTDNRHFYFPTLSS